MTSGLAAAAPSPAPGDSLAQAAAVTGGRPPVTLLAATDVAARRAGRATGASCTSVDALIGQLAGAELADHGLEPAPPWAVRHVLRQEAAAAGGAWARVAEDAGALATVAGAHDELRRLDGDALQELGRWPGPAGDVVRLLLAVRARLQRAGLADEVDRRRAAWAAVATGKPEVGSLVLLDGLPRTPADAALLGALTDRTDGAQRVDGWPTRAATASCTDVVACDEPEDVARAAVRAVLAAAEAGGALAGMAVVHPAGSAYARLVHRELRAAGVPAWGPPTRGLDGTAAGRALVGLLELAGGEWRREAVMSWMAGAPLASADGSTVPAARWNAVSAAAGVVRGLDQWHERLRRLAAGAGTSAGTTPVEQAAADLAAFVDELAARTVVPAGGRWAEWAGWAQGLLDRYLPDPGPGSWPAAERAALAAVGRAVAGLAGLDTLSGGPDLAAFSAAVRAELAHGQEPAPGDERGVLVAPFAEARGAPFDTVIAVGLDERSLERAWAPDPLLPDELCAADPSGTLPTAARRRAEGEDDLLAVLGGASTRRTAIWARHDVAHAGRQGPWRGMHRLVDGGIVVHRPEPAGASPADGPPLHAAELTLRALAQVHHRGGDIARSAPVAAVDRLEAGIELVRGRAGRAFTRFDGRAGTWAAGAPGDERPMSATGLETYAECPRRFLFSRVLGVEARPAPEDLWRIEARDRGSLVHAILERYVVARLSGAPRSLELLLGVAEELLDEASAAGRVGRTLPWTLDRAAIVRDLHVFHVEEGDDHPLAAELGFGTGEPGAAAPVRLVLRNGRAVRLRGRVDRIDRDADGVLVVSDYKTGRQASLARSAADPMAGGRRLQLPLYALAARAHFDAPDGVRARYWMVSAERTVARSEVVLDAALEARFTEVVGRIVEGVDAGAFPGVPGPPVAGGFANCRWCDFDRICPADRGRHWAGKRGDDTLSPVVRLFDTEASETLGGGPGVAP